MLVFVSDLHFLDETTGVKNLPKSAFEKFISSLTTHVQKAKDVKKLEIVFLGDIFDLLRSETWFEEEEKDRPWGSNTNKMKARANSILKNIIEKNKETFKLFSKESLIERFGGMDIESIYIPGNHDRLCWMIDSLKEKVIKALDLNPGNKENFKQYFTNNKHGVYALHGHIFDSFNYEGGLLHNKQDYKLVPIGDPITTEILIKIPYKLAQKIKSTEILSEKEKIQLIKNFQEIGNIRPYSAIFGWLLYQIKVNKSINEIIEDTVDEVMREFNRLKFVKNWYKKHDTLHPLDIADKIQYITLGLEKCKILPMKKIPGFFVDWVIKKFSSESDIKGALKLFSTIGDDIHYLIMGHTHNALQQSLFTESFKNKRIRESVYLNTGTWIKNYYECKEYNSFVGWKNMNYVIVYTPDEKPNKHNLPVFETWQGTEKREE